jgi:type I restriction enzyme R subunit
MFDAPESDIFDVLAHLSFDQQIKTRAQRTKRVRDHGMTIQSIEPLAARQFLEYVLEYYTQHGSTEIIQSKIGDIIKLYGRGSLSIVDLAQSFGGHEQLVHAWKQVQGELFRI